MRRSRNQTAIVFASRALVLSLVLTVGFTAAARADESVLEPARHVRSSAAGRAALAPAAPSNTGGDTAPLPTPVKQPRSPRVPPVWSPFTGTGFAGTVLQVWIGAQSAWQAVAARVQGER